MFEHFFGNKSIEKILFFLLVNGKCYANQLKNNFHTSLSPFQKGLERLEQGGIIISRLEGKTRIYQFNPRYPFLKETTDLLAKGYEFLPNNIKKTYYEPPSRKRPRKKGKPL